MLPTSHRPQVLLLTGDEMRHRFARCVFANSSQISLRAVISEDSSISLRTRVETNPEYQDLLIKYVEARQLSEEDFFSNVISLFPDNQNLSVIPKGDINQARWPEMALEAGNEVVACYGTSILKGKWLDLFEDRMINLHLGLSPYYMGSGTNFWAMAHGRFECIGATFMILDKGVDTGPILHQIRARVCPGDTPHMIGNRLISDALKIYPNIVRQFCGFSVEDINMLKQKKELSGEFGHFVICKRKDFTVDALIDFQKKYISMRDEYLSNIEKMQARAPLISIMSPEKGL